MTLLDFDASEKHGILQTFKKFNKNVSESVVDVYHKINIDIWKSIEKQEIDKEKALVLRFERLFEQLSITDISASEFANWYEFELSRYYKYIDGAKELVEELKEKGFYQYLVTNGVAFTQRGKLKLSGLDQIVDGIFISEEMGAPKPQKEFFERCFELMQHPPLQKCIIIGDSLTSDMQGGLNYGLDTIWINWEQLPVPEDYKISYSVSSLTEIRNILEL